jgi:hypothetical protein
LFSLVDDRCCDVVGGRIEIEIRKSEAAGGSYANDGAL